MPPVSQLWGPYKLYRSWPWIPNVLPMWGPCWLLNGKIMPIKPIRPIVGPMSASWVYYFSECSAYELCYLGQNWVHTCFDITNSVPGTNTCICVSSMYSQQITGDVAMPYRCRSYIIHLPPCWLPVTLRQKYDHGCTIVTCNIAIVDKEYRDTRAITDKMHTSSWNEGRYCNASCEVYLLMCGTEIMSPLLHPMANFNGNISGNNNNSHASLCAASRNQEPVPLLLTWHPTWSSSLPLSWRLYADFMMLVSGSNVLHSPR